MSAFAGRAVPPRTPQGSSQGSSNPRVLTKRTVSQNFFCKIPGIRPFNRSWPPAPTSVSRWPGHEQRLQPPTATRDRTRRNRKTRRWPSRSVRRPVSPASRRAVCRLDYRRNKTNKTNGKNPTMNANKPLVNARHRGGGRWAVLVTGLALLVWPIAPLHAAVIDDFTWRAGRWEVKVAVGVRQTTSAGAWPTTRW